MAPNDMHPCGPVEPEAAAGNVLVVDERRPFAQSLAQVLDDLGMDVSVMIEPGLDGAVPAPSVPGRSAAVLDAGLGAPGDAPSLARSLTSAGWTVLVLSRPGDPLSTAACIDAGAVAHVGADAALEDLIEAVRRVLEGHRVALSRPDRERLLEMLRRSRAESARVRRPFERLTPRERAVLAGLTEGRRAGQIAADAVVSVVTVRNQIQSVLTKLGVASQLEAVALARRAGWTPDDPS